jgi:DNA-binding LacI/PurR family transcriptional regulator
VSGYRPLYQVIVDDVIQKVRNGDLAPGDQLGSLAHLCDHYGVALATAHRSVTDLVKQGVIKTIPRKGAFVVGVPTPPAVEQSASVRRIVLVESTTYLKARSAETNKNNFSDGTVEAIVNVCRQYQIPMEFQFIPVDPSAAARIFFTPRSGDAIIAVGAGVSIALLSHLATPNVPSVLVDAAVPNAHCVLTDNYLGMYQVASHLHACGHRRVGVGVCYATRGANTTNENERRDALLHHARIAGMQASVMESGDWDALFNLFRTRLRPSAMVFTRDVAAIEFIRRARQRGMRVPQDISVVGFDNWGGDAPELQELTTVRVDVEAMGKAAVELVLNSQVANSNFYHWQRVAPMLIHRASVANVDPMPADTSSPGR